jgi:hypothetical protein
MDYDDRRDRQTSYTITTNVRGEALLRASLLAAFGASENTPQGHSHDEIALTATTKTQFLASSSLIISLVKTVCCPSG